MQGILTAGTVSKVPFAISGAGHRGVDLSSGLERWARGLMWSEGTPPQVGSGSNPLSRTHFPSGFAWVRGSGFAKQVGSQWVRAKVGFWPCGFAVGSRQSGFAKVGSSGFANVGSRKVGSRGKHQVGSRVGSQKWVREWVREKGVSGENVSGGERLADSGFASGFAWNPLAFRSGFGQPSCAWGGAMCRPFAATNGFSMISMWRTWHAVRAPHYR